MNVRRRFSNAKLVEVRGKILNLQLGDSSPKYRFEGNHGTGKTGKMAKKIPCQGKHREFGNFAKTQGILLAQVVNFLILQYLPRKFPCIQMFILSSEMMLANVFKQLIDEALKVSRNQTVSTIVENLLKEATEEQLVQFMVAFATDWETACTDRFAGYVTQTLLHRIKPFIKDSSEEQSPKTLFLELYGFLMGNLPVFMQVCILRKSDFSKVVSKTKSNLP